MLPTSSAGTKPSTRYRHWGDIGKMYLITTTLHPPTSTSITFKYFWTSGSPTQRAAPYKSVRYSISIWVVHRIVAKKSAREKSADKFQHPSKQVSTSCMLPKSVSPTGTTPVGSLPQICHVASYSLYNAGELTGPRSAGVLTGPAPWMGSLRVAFCHLASNYIPITDTYIYRFVKG